VVLGALTYTKFEQYDDLTAELGIAGFRGPPIAMMIVGTVVFFIAFMGCCGAIRGTVHSRDFFFYPEH